MKTLFERMSEAQTMTNTPSPTDEDRELIERLNSRVKIETACGNRTGNRNNHVRLMDEAADRLESLLSDRAKLEEALGKYDRLFSQTRGFQELYDAHEEIGAALDRSTDRGV